MTNEEYVKRLQRTVGRIQRGKASAVGLPVMRTLPALWTRRLRAALLRAGYPGNGNTAHFLGENITYTSQQ
jgi:hypothetical protein